MKFIGSSSLAVALGALALALACGGTPLTSTTSLTSGGATGLTYTVSTLAGTPLSPGSGNGTGSGASFNHPGGVAVDGSGNVYVADTNNNVIRKITATGVVTTLAGTPGPSGSANGTGPAAGFFEPNGVAVDLAGNVYVADSFNSTIRKITPGGLVSTLAGTPGVLGSANGLGPAASFNLPSGVAVDGAGYVYVADSNNSIIRKITPGGQVSTLAGTALSTGSADGLGATARFNYPYGLTLDGLGNVYVADTNNAAIRLISPAGLVATLAVTGGSLLHPSGLTLDATGNLYVADTYNQVIRVISTAELLSTAAGTLNATGSTGGAGTVALFNYPGDVAVDATGTIFVADTANSTIRKITH